MLVVAALLTQRTTVRQQVTIIATLLFSYWFAMTLLPVPGEGTIGALLLNDPPRTLAAWTDRLFLDWSRWGMGNHLWVNSVTWDPEGILSTIPAICTAMLGNLAGRWIGQKERPINDRLVGMYAAGSLGMMAALMWHWVFPINKSLWTSSYVLFTAGVALLSIATIMWLVDVHGLKGWTKPAVIYGVNPIIAFVGSGVMARCIYSIFKVTSNGQRIPLETWLYQTFFLSWLNPINASLAFAISFVVLWYLILLVLWRKNIILKV